MNMKYVLFLILSATMSGNPVSDYMTSSEHVLAIYQAIKDVHEVLQEYQIPYWMHAGTLLGAVRHKGLIPWDDDVDIVIAQKDEHAFVKILPVFKSLGYRILSMNSAYKLTFTQSDKVAGSVDVMIFEKDNNKYAYPKYLELPAHWMFKESEVFPLREYQFGEIMIMGPHNPIPYLDRVYDNWRTTAAIYNHSGLTSPQRVSLNSDLSTFAKPTGPLRDRTLYKKHKAKEKAQYSNLNIQEASESDANSLSQLIIQLGFPETSAELCYQKVRLFSQSGRDKIWVARVENKIVGVLALNIIAPFYHPGLFARIDTIVVDKEYQNQGIGKKLIEVAENYALAVGCQRIFLTSGKHRLEAHNFYMHLGYQSNATYFVKYLEH